MKVGRPITSLLQSSRSKQMGNCIPIQGFPAADFLSRAHTPGLWVVLGGCEPCTLTPNTEAKGLDSSSSSYSSTVGNPAGQLSSGTRVHCCSHQALTGVFPPKGSSCDFHFPSPRCQGYCLSSSLPWHPCLSRSSHSILSLFQ
ncbi:uncharacterized protein [Chlorocebus sabaeus]|uniref:uncharacterized protein n=1 Tax=Chlorocebus sabaeus TaxID=60711 RepID=UPI003BF9E780